MNTRNPNGPGQSSRLGNIHIGAEGGKLELDGREIELSGARERDTLEAVKAFYDEALAAYAKSALIESARRRDASAGIWHRAAQLLNPGTWWGGLKKLFVRVFGPGDAPPPSAAAAPPLAQPPPPAEPTPAATPQPTAAKVATTAAAPVAASVAASTTHAAPSLRADAPALAAGAPALTRAAPASTAAARSSATIAIGPGPQLLSAYADPQGVHLLWSVSPDGKRVKQSELLCALDSPVADRLQACYGRLADLGHPIVDMKIWRPAPGPMPSSGSTPATSASAAHSPAAAPTPAKPEPAGTIMRLHPGPSDTPGRAVVTPVDDNKSMQILTGPERLIDALHTAADPDRPAADRLTYLRCASSRSGLKVVAVGLGKDATDPRAPARWESISPWFEAAKKAPAAAPAAPRPDPIPVSPEPAMLPHKTPEPELF